MWLPIGKPDRKGGWGRGVRKILFAPDHIEITRHDGLQGINRLYLTKLRPDQLSIMDSIYLVQLHLLLIFFHLQLELWESPY